jgi:hypothetical protein
LGSVSPYPDKKRGGSSDNPREKPKNPKGRSIEPPCLATPEKNHEQDVWSSDFDEKTHFFFELGKIIEISCMVKGFFIAR